jgi:hypothetical protein
MHFNCSHPRTDRLCKLLTNCMANARIYKYMNIETLSNRRAWHHSDPYIFRERCYWRKNLQLFFSKRLEGGIHAFVHGDIL